MVDINDLENRIKKLEEVVFGGDAKPIKADKAITLPELARQKGLDKANGQSKITAIVGFNEKIANRGSSKPSDLKAGWIAGKFTSRYNTAFVQRALKEGLIRPLDDGSYDLTQTGENFFNELVAE